MIKLSITHKIKQEYIKVLEEVLHTTKTKSETACYKRFHVACSNIGVNKSTIENDLFLNKNITSIIKAYGVKSFKKEDYSIYNAFRKTWAYKLVNLLDLTTCPYCNRNFTVNFDKNGTTVELDHFYPKSQYPYLAISLYNLIPVCHTCNHKKDELKLKIYPYKEAYNDYVKFSFSINGAEFNNKDSISLEYIQKQDRKQDRKKINNYHRVLNIPTLYNNHKDIVLELIQKREIYSDSYIDELMQNFEGKVFGSRDDLMRLITCGYVNDEDINKRPLSKLIKDITEELEFI